MGDWIKKSELARSYQRATKAGEARLARQPRAATAHYDARKSRLVIELTNGVILMLPRKLLQGLKNATAAQLRKVELTPLGTGLHWEALDAELSVAGLAAGVFGSKAWMSELARYAGSRTKEPINESRFLPRERASSYWTAIWRKSFRPPRR